MIGYILLIAIVIGISVVVYQWIKTYVPREATDCPDGTAIQIKGISCTSSGGGYDLNFVLKNNGRFKISGYLIYATTSAEQELATYDLSSKIESGGELSEDQILFSDELQPNSEIQTSFSIDSVIYAVEIIPFRYQKAGIKETLVNCGNAKTKEGVSCT